MRAVAEMPATLSKNQVLNLTIDKTKPSIVSLITPGDTTAVAFHANEDCVLRFTNPGVFGKEYLRLSRHVLYSQTVLARNEKTEVEVLLSIDPQKVRPWPIIP